MKIRQDFITNSSSTSFIISMKDDLTLDNFLMAIGLEKSFGFINIFEKMFELIQYRSTKINNLAAKKKQTIDEYLDNQYSFDTETIKTIKKLLKEKSDVYIGNFWDDADCEEGFFCRTSLFISNNKIYFNSKNDDY